MLGSSNSRKPYAKVDDDHLITVGVIPWSHVFPGAKPIFYAPAPAEHLDFVSVHMYPKAGEVQKALDALTVYRIGKPIVVRRVLPAQLLDRRSRGVYRQVEDRWLGIFLLGQVDRAI